MSPRTYEIEDNQWERIKDMPPEKTGEPRRPCETPNRTVFSGFGIQDHVERTAAQIWKKSTVYDRFRAWKDPGALEPIVVEFSKDCDMQDLSFDRTSCKVHQYAVGAKRGRKKQV